MLSGIDSLSDAELLSVLLMTRGRGAPLATLSATLLDEHGGVGGLARLGLGELAEYRGVGPAKAVRLAAAIELGRRSVQAASREASESLPDRRAVVVNWAAPTLATLDHEELGGLPSMDDTACALPVASHPAASTACTWGYAMSYASC